MKNNISNQVGCKKKGCSIEEYIIPHGKPQTEKPEKVIDRTIRQKAAGL